MQNTLFAIKPKGIMGLLRPFSLEHKALFEDQLYSRLPEPILYNHCFHYLYSYFSGVKTAYFMQDKDEFVVVTQKNKTNPIYSVHCPICSYDKLNWIIDELSKITIHPIRVIDLNEQQKDEIIKNDPDRWTVYKMGKDVIFDLEKCVGIKGNPYKGIRQGINHFNKNFPHYLRVMRDQQTADDACKVIDQWKKTQGQKYFRITTGRDIELFRRLWPAVDMFNTFGMVAYNKENDQPIGAIMCCRSPRRQDFGMELTTKVLPEYRGLTDVLSWEMFKAMFENGIKYSNEAGIYSPGIRFNKEKWRPVDYYPMFDVERK